MLEKFKDKKIGILGFALEGKATFEYLKQHGIKASIIDKSEEHSLREANPDFDFSQAESMHLGQDHLEALKTFDVIFKTPGISPNIPEILAAKEAGVDISSQIELFFDVCPAKIIGVTGTKGKGTTSTLIYQILKNAGKDVWLGGNIGVPAISFVDDLKPDSLAVLELSSFQLQVLKKSPHIAVVLNITSEHLDYHKDTEEYREAKKNILLHQNPTDLAVINDDYEVPKSFAEVTKAEKYFVSKEHKTNGCYVNEKDQIVLVSADNAVVGEFKELKLRGRHNLENVTAATMASFLAGANIDVISRTIKEFSGLEHRLELVREINGVKFYNDSFSTVPETAIAAMSAFEEPKIMILGGSYKGSNYTELGSKIADSNVKALILIGDMAEEINRTITVDFTVEKVFGLTNMTEIVAKAYELAEKGDVVLLSPACASFGLFKNYKDRGNQFKEVVNRL